MDAVLSNLMGACDQVDVHVHVADPVLAEALHQARRACLVEKHRDVGPPAEELLDALYAAALATGGWCGAPRWAGLRTASLAYVAWRRTNALVSAAHHVRARRIEAPGANGRACPECGNFTVITKGTCEGCTMCPWQGGCG